MIRFRTLGGLELSDSQGRDLHALLSKPKRLALLAYLASHNHHASRRRDSVVALFWPDMDAAHARGSLRQALRFLRRELGDGVLNGRSEEEIGFEPHSLECDAVTFERACDAGRLSEAVQLYRGDFLDGFYVAGGSAELERWIEGERIRLRQLAARAAAELSQHAEREGNLAQAVEAARQGVALEPDDEKGLARLIALLDRSGDRAGALSTFETFRRRLEKEYDATPSPETAARIQAIRTRQTPFAEVATPRLSARRRPVRRVLWSVVGGVVATAMIGWLSVSETHRSSVAVLPLTNATQDTALTYLTEGLSQGVTAALSQIPGLRVAKPAAVQAHEAVNADAVIAWTLRRQGDSLVLAVELRGTATSASQWAREFPLSASGALAVEGRVVGEVVGQLRPRLIDSIDLRQLHRTTASADAYLLYLQGRYFLGRRSPESISRARGLFAQAIERDPVYAAAYAGLGYSYVALAYYWAMPSREAFPLAEAAARRALQIDSTIGFAQALVAEATASYHWRWAAAEPLYRRAIALDPTDPESHHLFGVYLRTLGRFEEAEAEMRRAVELDPLTRHFAYQLARVLACAGRSADAALEFEKQLALDSVYPPAHYELAKVLARQGAYDAAIKELATGARQWGDTAYTRLVQGRRGSAGYTAARLLGATRSLERLRARAQRGYVPPVAFAREYIQLGRREESLASLSRGFEVGDVTLATTNCDPEYAPLRTDPRFQDLRHRMGLQ
ncbi:MAG TPA: BTAD domain-containing putative transcriptional regulator [Gemmatimonadales bacterium]|nr:BTAD domain-containing putative transcriptional regulator [Gemmatimonadales bacterium]